MPDRIPFASRAGSYLAAFSLLATAMPLSLAAQDASEYVLRVRAAGELLVDLEAAAAAYRARAEQERTAFDTLRVGPLRLLSANAESAEVRAAAELALVNLRTRYGGAVDLLARRPAMQAGFVVRPVAAHLAEVRAPDGYGYAADSTASSIESPTRPLAVYGIQDRVEHVAAVASARTTVALSAALEGLLERMLSDPSGAAIGSWLHRSIPLRTSPPPAWAQRRIHLVSSGSAAVRDCYAGRIERCKQSLGLGHVGDPLMDLYDASDRRRAFLAGGWTASGRNLRCSEGDDSACIAELRDRGWPPTQGVSINLLESVMEEAIAMGGDGAVERLLSASADPIEALETVARAPLDTILTSWHSHIVSADHPSDNASPLILLSSILWAAAFAGASLRSSRWR